MYAFNDALTSYESFMSVSRTDHTIDIVNFQNGTLQYGGVEVATLDDLSGAAGYSGCVAYKNVSSQSIGSASWTAVTFNAEAFDDNGMHDNATNNTRMTVQTGITRVRLKAKVLFAGSTSTSDRIRITKNGSTTYTGYTEEIIPVVTGLQTPLSVTSPVLSVSAGDYFEVEVYQDSGGSVSIQAGGYHTWFEMEEIA
jgi:hypothetical protein